MTMLCIERSTFGVARHELWWTAAKLKAIGTPYAPYVANLETAGNRWLVLDEGFLLAWGWFSRIPGWEGADGLGRPLTVRKLSVGEEHYATRNAPTSERATFVEACACPPSLPRKVRREADRASKKLIERAIRKGAK